MQFLTPVVTTRATKDNQIFRSVDTDQSTLEERLKRIQVGKQ